MDYKKRNKREQRKSTQLIDIFKTFDLRKLRYHTNYDKAKPQQSPLFVSKTIRSENTFCYEFLLPLIRENIEHLNSFL